MRAQLPKLNPGDQRHHRCPDTGTDQYRRKPAEQGGGAEQIEQIGEVEATAAIVNSHSRGEAALERFGQDVAGDDTAAANHAEQDRVISQPAAAQSDADADEEQGVDERGAGVVVGMSPTRGLAADARQLAIGAIEEGRDYPDDATPDIDDRITDGEESAGEQPG